MKYLILIFIVTILNAKPFFSKAQIDCAKTENCYLKNYMKKAACEKEEGSTCYDIANCKPDVCTIQDVEVDDLDKPIYAKRTNETDCKIYDYVEGEEFPADNCGTLTATKNVGTEEKPIYEHNLCTDKTYYALYAQKEDFGLGDGYFVYCTKLLGYEQMIVKKLKEDPVLKAAKEEKKALELAEKEAKELAKKTAKEVIATAKGNVKTLNKEALNNLLENLIILLGD